MHRIFTLGVCLTITALLAACGGGDDDGDISPTGNGTTTTVERTSASTATTGSNGATGVSGAGGPAATGATGSTEAGGDTPHACTLLTPDEVNELIGDDAAASEGRDYLATSANATQCEWQLQNGALYVEVLGQGASSWFEAVNFGNTNPPIDGLGDKAIIGPGGTLDVLQGDYMVSVQLILFFSQTDKDAVARDIAEAVLSKLP